MALFLGFLTEYLLWIKALHIISIVAWMAGLFYLPRLFVYHVADLSQFNDPQSSIAKLFQTMEYRLFYAIMVPSMIFSLISGIVLAMILSTWSSGWMHLKILGVLGLLVFHILLNRWRISLREGSLKHGETFFRCVNEIPTLLLIVIVVCVVVKPF